MGSVKTDSIVALQQRVLDGKGLRVGICKTQWNEKIISKLLEGCQTELLNAGVLKEDIIVETVPGNILTIQIIEKKKNI